jgi:Icc protein
MRMSDNSMSNNRMSHDEQSNILLRFAHISDTHITPDLTYSKPYAQYPPLVGAQALVKAINALPVELDFILHTGDVIYDPFPEVYATAQALFEPLKAPLYYVAGNHDDLEGIQKHLMDWDDIQDYPYYEVDIDGVQLVVVDSNAPAESPAGNVSADQLEWLNAICTDDSDTRPLIIATHHQPLPSGTPWLDDWMRMENGEVFHGIVAQAHHRLRGVFHGHIHQQTQTFRDGVLYSSVGSPWCQFFSVTMPHNDTVIPDFASKPSFNIVTLTSEQTFIKQYSFDVDYQAPKTCEDVKQGEV